MGVFSRLRDIVNSNINSMVEKAEDPEKLIKLMIMEMEDTLVEIKSSAAGVMATRKKVQRALEHCRKRSEDWGEKAQLAMNKDREDLAREALLEKHHYRDQAGIHQRELAEFDVLVEQYQDDIRQLEDKLAEAKEKHRVLVQRHVHAKGAKRVQTQIRKAESKGAFARFEALESRIDRAEAEAELVNYGRRPTLEDKFKVLEEEETIEKELRELKAAKAGKGKPGDSA
jgi:phage shock protein A